MNKYTIAQQIRTLREAKEEAVDGKSMMRINNTIQSKATILRDIIAREEANEIQCLVNNFNLKYGMNI